MVLVRARQSRGRKARAPCTRLLRRRAQTARPAVATCAVPRTRSRHQRSTAHPLAGAQSLCVRSMQGWQRVRAYGARRPEAGEWLALVREPSPRSPPSTAATSSAIPDPCPSVGSARACGPHIGPACEPHRREATPRLRGFGRAQPRDPSARGAGSAKGSQGSCGAPAHPTYDVMCVQQDGAPRAALASLIAPAGLVGGPGAPEMLPRRSLRRSFKIPLRFYVTPRRNKIA